MRMHPPRSFTALSTTPIDLYTARARLQWYYSLTATVSAWLALAGYTLLVLAFTSNPPTLRISRGVITTLGSCGLLFGYGGAVATAFLSKSVLFAYEDVSIPVLTSSFMGLFEVVANLVLHTTFDFLPNNAYTVVPIVVAAITTILSAAGTFVLWRRVRKVKARDARIRVRGSDAQFADARPSAPGYNYGENPSGLEMYAPHPDSGWVNLKHLNQASSQAIVDVLPDDEAQRRQLIRLLMTKGRDGSLGNTSSTYKIDLPWQDDGQQRPRSGSLPAPSTQPAKKSRWGISTLVPGLGRQRSDSDVLEGFKDPRERRREEIERAGILQRSNLHSPDPGGNWANARSPARHGHNSSTGSFGWAGTSRYA